LSVTDIPHDDAEQPAGNDPAEERRQARYWNNQIKAAEERESKWRKRAEQVRKRYLDEEEGASDYKSDHRRINILWSNTEVLKSALFSRIGDPDVRRAFPKPGADNKAARTAAVVLERTMTACANRYDLDAELEDGVFDQILPGRGQVWLEYEPGDDAEDAESPDDGSPGYQDVRIVHVPFDQWLHGPGKKWHEVPWVARRHLMDKDSVKEAFGDEVASEAPYNEELSEGAGFENEHDRQDFQRAVAWEIWDKKRLERVYIIEGVHRILRRDEDPYRLEGFFPCPPPLLASHQSDSLLPVPEYVLYQKQADELDRLNTRIYNLVEKMRYCGIYDGSGEDVEVLENLGSLEDGKFLPYKNFQALQSRGGLEKAFQTRDLAPIGQAIQQLTVRAEQVMQIIWQTIGIADIMRGSSDPSETLGAQQMKAQFGSQRLRKRQMAVERWVKSALRCKAEIIAEYFERDQLQEMSGIALPTRAEIEQAEQQLQEVQQARQQLQQMQQQAAQGQQQPQIASQGPQAGAQAQNPQDAPDAPQGNDIALYGEFEQYRQQMQMQRLQQAASVPEDKLAELQEIAEAVPWEDVERILRSDDRRNNKIDVETDITAFEQTEEEKQRRIEYVQSTLQLLRETMPAIQGQPAMAKFAKELTIFGSRSFKVGRTLEESLEEAFDGMAKAEPQPDADQQNAKAKQQELQMKMQFEQARLQIDQRKAQFDMQEQQAERQIKLQEAEQEQQIKSREIQIKETEAELKRIELNAQLQSQQLESENKSQEIALKRADVEGKLRDMDERRQADMEDRTQRRDAEISAIAESINQQLQNEGSPMFNMLAQRMGEAATQAEQLTAQASQAQSEIAQSQQMIADAIGQMMQQNQQTQQQTAEAFGSLAQAIDGLRAAQTAPRTLVKDENGRPMGVRIDLEQAA